MDHAIEDVFLVYSVLRKGGDIFPAKGAASAREGGKGGRWSESERSLRYVQRASFV